MTPAPRTTTLKCGVSSVGRSVSLPAPNRAKRWLTVVSGAKKVKLTAPLYLCLLFIHPRARRVQKHKRTQDPRAGTFRIRGVQAGSPMEARIPGHEHPIQPLTLLVVAIAGWIQRD